MELPHSITAAVTDRCNSRCTKCGVWRMNSRTTEMPPETWIDAVHRLHRWLGPYELVLSGGEPTLKPGYLDILRTASDLGVLAVLNSNGLRLDRDGARAVARTGVFNLTLSVDGPREINDRIKGIPGATWRLWDAVETLHCTRSSIKITLLIVLMRPNMALIPAFVDSVLRDERVTRVRFQAIVPPLGGNEGDRWFAESDLWPDNPAAVDRTLDWLIGYKQAGERIDNRIEHFEMMRVYFRNPTGIAGVPCSVGRNTFIIRADGAVLLCGHMEPVGDVTAQDPEAIWNGPVAVRRREEIQRCSRFCHQLVNCCSTDDTHPSLAARMQNRERD